MILPTNNSNELCAAAITLLENWFHWLGTKKSLPLTTQPALISSSGCWEAQAGARHKHSNSSGTTTLLGCTPHPQPGTRHKAMICWSWRGPRGLGRKSRGAYGGRDKSHHCSLKSAYISADRADWSTPLSCGIYLRCPLPSKPFLFP